MVGAIILNLEPYDAKIFYMHNYREMVGRGGQSKVWLAKTHLKDGPLVLKTVSKLWLCACSLLGNNFLDQRINESLNLVKEYFPENLVKTRLFTNYASTPIIGQKYVKEIIPVTSDAVEYTKIEPDLRRLAAANSQMYQDTGFVLDLFGEAIHDINQRFKKDPGFWAFPNLVLDLSESLASSKIVILDFYLFQIKSPATFIDLVFKNTRCQTMLKMQKRLGLEFVDTNKLFDLSKTAIKNLG